MMSLFWTIIFLNLAFGIQYLEGKNQKKFPSAVVVGTVYCDTCFKQGFPKASHFISGASVAIECKGAASMLSFRQEVKTNKLGEFKIHLPFSVSKKVKKIKGCSVKLIRSGDPYCAVAATATSNSLHLKSRKEGTHIFSAGFFTFKPLNQPSVCAQKPSIRNLEKQNIDDQKSPVLNPDDPTFLPPIRYPPSDQPPHFGPFLPPLPSLPRLPPLPQLPRLPPLPGLLPYIPPVPNKTATNESQSLGDNVINQPASIPMPTNPLNPPSIFPPNPLQPPPSLLPPNPFQPPPSIIPPVFPSPPPSIFPPFFPSPPSPPFFSLPPFPGLTTSPPPPPPTFPIPFPPFPFQPTPGFPGVPPADGSSRSKTNSP